MAKVGYIINMISYEDIKEDTHCEDDEKEIETSESFSFKFLKTRQIFITGEVNDEMSKDVVKKLFTLEANGDEPIYIYIDSPGGSVHSGFAIYDAINFIKAPVYTIGMGAVASAGCLIYLAAPKENRLAFRHSEYLIHQPLSQYRGTAIDFEIQALNLEKTKNTINNLIAERTGQPIKKICKDTDRDFWLTAEEAIEYGIVNRIVDNRNEI